MKYVKHIFCIPAHLPTLSRKVTNRRQKDALTSLDSDMSETSEKFADMIIGDLYHASQILLF